MPRPSSHPPRVAFLGYAHDARGGIAQFGRGLAERVAAEADVRMIGYRRLYPRFTAPGRQSPDPSAAAAAHSGAQITVPWLPWTWKATADALRGFAPDLLVVQWWTPLLGPSVRSILGRARRDDIRSLVMVHNDKPHERFPAWRQITAATLRRADALAAFTPAVADAVRGFVPSATVPVHPLPQALVPTAPDGAGDWEARLGSPPGPVILFFGNVRAYKGLDDLMAALPLVRREVDATLVVAGTFMEPLKRFEARARELGVAEAVRFIAEYVPDEEVGGLFGRSDVVALPYRSAPGSGVLGQAAQYRRPVVATAVGALPDLIGDNGVLVAPSDIPALADGLVRAIRRPPPPPPLDADAWDRWAMLVLQEARG